MKKRTQILGISVLLFTGMSALNSCKKSEKGCTDSQAINYNSEAELEEGNSACIYPADKLTGSWTVSETVLGNTTTYPATIVKKDNTTITISSTRTNPPVYYLGSFYATVKWSVALIENPDTNIIVVDFSGTIENENDFEINYVYGISPYLYSVSLHYTR